MKTNLIVFAVLIFSTINLAAQTPVLSDTDIAHVGVAANQIDIEYAKIALKRSKNKSVRAFAETMSNDHTSVIAQASELVTKLGVTPTDNAVSKSLNSDAALKRKELKAVGKEGFDKAYIENEVIYHQAVIDAVKNLLIPQTQNPELKALLEGIVPALETHLKHAKMVKDEL